jgi:hypothetical protein
MNWFPDALTALKYGLVLTDDDLHIRGETVDDLRAENLQAAAKAEDDPWARVRELEAELRRLRGGSA